MMRSAGSRDASTVCGSLAGIGRSASVARGAHAAFLPLRALSPPLQELHSLFQVPDLISEIGNRLGLLMKLFKLFISRHLFPGSLWHRGSLLA